MKNLILIVLCILSSCSNEPCVGEMLPVMDFAIFKSDGSSLITSSSQQVNLYAVINNIKRPVEHQIRKVGDSYGVSSPYLISENVKTFYLELEGKTDTLHVETVKSSGKGCNSSHFLKVGQVFFNGQPAQKISPSNEMPYYKFIRSNAVLGGK